MMRRPQGRPPLRPAERELYAFACLDSAENIHWIRVFETSIVRRTLAGRLHGSGGRRLETANGSAVQEIDAGLYLVFCEHSLEWIEVESMNTKKVRHGRRIN